MTSNHKPEISFKFGLFQLSNQSTPDITYCECNHLTSFTSEFVVAPNVPDFSVWADNPHTAVLSNPAVVSFCLGVIGLYILLALWARRKDNKDLYKVNSLVMSEMVLNAR